MSLRALSLPGCGCRGAFQFAVMARLAAGGERFDLVAGASSGSLCAAATVAGVIEDGPAMWREVARTPVVSRQWLGSDGSPFGMTSILRAALARFLPEERLVGTDAELLVATARASRLVRGLREALVVHSNRSRRDLHDVIAASCYIPLVYSRPTYLDGELHVDGGAADNTLVDTLVARGATEVTLVTPYPEGVVSRTLFSPELEPIAPPGVRLRIFYPERRLAQRRFAFAPGPLEEALTMPHRMRIIEPRGSGRAVSSPGRVLERDLLRAPGEVDFRS